MPKERSPKEVYDNLATKGLYEEANFDKDEVRKILTMALEDYTFTKKLCKMPNPSWRVIFTAHYDVFRELCDQLMRFERQKISNHKGLFAFIILHFDSLAFDWGFLEKIRTIRNKSEYEGRDVSKDTWKEVELQFDLYISATRQEIEKRLR